VTQKGTDRRTWLYRLGCCWSGIYILYGVCHASFCPLRIRNRPFCTFL